MGGHCKGDAKKGHDYTGAQLETKLYISPCYQELSDIFELTPIVKPAAVCSIRALQGAYNECDVTDASFCSSCSMREYFSPGRVTPRKEAKKSTGKGSI